MFELSLSSERSRLLTAMLVAVAADAVQIALLPLFSEGAISPVDDILDVGVAALLIGLVGWHWEFMPSFLAELLPGIDLVPSWTLAVANVYRKRKKTESSGETIDVKPVGTKLPTGS